MNRAALQGLHLHLDPVSGISGDMTVGALVDAGVPESTVTGAVAAVGVPGLKVRFESRRRGAYVGRGFVVEEPGNGKSSRKKKTARRAQAHAHTHEHGHGREHGHEHEHTHDGDSDHVHDHGQVHDQVHRDYADIRGLLRRARFDSDAKELAEEIFARLAEVEAALHGMPLQRVTFHEVGAFDSIADIVAFSAAIAWLAPASIGSSAPVVGTGTVRTAHGVVPVPAPATLALLQGIPMVAEGLGELTTPTGAAFLATAVDSFGPPPPMRVRAVGYGAGTRIVPDRSNVLRVLLGEPIGRALAAAAEDVLVVETNIDDMTGELLSALFDALFAAGALDVWSAPIIMKKGRPAHQVSALVEPAKAEAVKRAFFLNSTTLGVRVSSWARTTLARSLTEVATPFGRVRVKVAGLDGAAIGAEPEYDDCRRLASAAGVPIRTVWRAAVAASNDLPTRPPGGGSRSGSTSRPRGKAPPRGGTGGNRRRSTRRGRA